MLALIAGTGALPGVIARAMAGQGGGLVICEMQGFAADLADLPDDVPRLTFRLETLGSLIARLAAMGVTRVCMAGAVRRPVIDPALIDAATAPLVARIVQALGQGDDGALRSLIALFEEPGMTVVGAHELVPGLLPPAGVLTRAAPSPQARSDAAVGDRVIAAMGLADLGQACVIRAGQVLAREDDRGTDAMLADLCLPTARPAGSGDPIGLVLDSVGDLIADAADWLSNAPDRSGLPASGATFCKAPKPGQDRRADLPLIGPATVKAAAAAGIDCMVLAAGGVMVIDRPQVCAIADAVGMAIWVREAAT